MAVALNPLVGRLWWARQENMGGKVMARIGDWIEVRTLMARSGTGPEVIGYSPWRCSWRLGRPTRRGHAVCTAGIWLQEALSPDNSSRSIDWGSGGLPPCCPRGCYGVLCSARGTGGSSRPPVLFSRALSKFSRSRPAEKRKGHPAVFVNHSPQAYENARRHLPF